MELPGFYKVIRRCPFSLNCMLPSARLCADFSFQRCVLSSSPVWRGFCLVKIEESLEIHPPPHTHPKSIPLATSHHYGFIGCLYIWLHINSGTLWADLALPTWSVDWARGLNVTIKKKKKNLMYYPKVPEWLFCAFSLKSCLVIQKWKFKINSEEK